MFTILAKKSLGFKGLYLTAHYLDALTGRLINSFSLRAFLLELF
jgi:hypothetical protein